MSGAHGRTYLLFPLKKRKKRGESGRTYLLVPLSPCCGRSLHSSLQSAQFIMSAPAQGCMPQAQRCQSYLSLLGSISQPLYFLHRATGCYSMVRGFPWPCVVRLTLRYFVLLLQLFGARRSLFEVGTNHHYLLLGGAQWGLLFQGLLRTRRVGRKFSFPALRNRSIVQSSCLGWSTRSLRDEGWPAADFFAASL